MVHTLPVKVKSTMLNIVEQLGIRNAPGSAFAQIGLETIPAAAALRKLRRAVSEARWAWSGQYNGEETRAGV